MTGQENDDNAAEALKQTIRAVLARASPRYDSTRKLLQVVRDITQDEIAQAFQPLLNRRARGTPHNSYEEKKNLVNFVNAELHQLGLAIRCPKTGLPTYLEANPGHSPEVGRFRLGYVDEEHHRRNSFTTIELPEFSLMPESNRLPRRRPRPGPSR